MAKQRAFVTTTPFTGSQTTAWHTYGALLLGIGAVSMSAIFIRLAQAESVASLLIAASRLGIAALVLMPITLRRHRADLRRLRQRDLLLIGMSGLFLALHFILWITSLEYTTVLISTVLVTTSPLWSAILERIFLRARLARLVLVGLAVAIVGGVLISLPGDGTDISLGSDPPLGIALALAGALAVSIYFVIGRGVRQHLPLLPYIWLVYSAAAIIAFTIVLVTATPVTGYSGEGYLWLLATGLIPQLIGHSAFNYVLGQLSATFVGIATQSEPIFSAILAFLVFNEIPQLPQIVGSAVILVGVIIATIGQSRPPQTEG